MKAARVLSLIAAAAIALPLAASLASAQQPAPSQPAPPQAAPPAAPGPGPGYGPGYGPRGWGPGMMMGPGMMLGRGAMGPGGFGFMCNPRMAGLAEWRFEQIERAVRPTEPQRKALDDLKAASAKAAETITATCPTEVPLTSTARLELMEKRMETMLQAIKTVRPAFEAFYNTLNDEQKARFDSAGPRRWGWQDWRWGWR